MRVSERVAQWDSMLHSDSEGSRSNHAAALDRSLGQNLVTRLPVNFASNQEYRSD